MATSPAFLQGAAPRTSGFRPFSPRCKLCVKQPVVWNVVHCSAAVGRTSLLREEISRIAGSERGLFNVQSASRAELDALIRSVEAECPAASPTSNCASAVAGRWRLLYTTLTILGRRRVALAIATESKPGFVRIADITQEIVPGSDEVGRSINEVQFKLLTGGQGRFVLDAEYRATSARRVEVNLVSSLLEPEKLRDVLGSNVELLTEIFNPEGFLEITYLDDELRVGRDHNGNVFVLERVPDDEDVNNAIEQQGA